MVVIEYSSLSLSRNGTIREDKTRLVFFPLSGGEEPLPAHVPAVPFPGHGVLL